MAQGKPSKWAQVTVTEPFLIGKRGITIKVWDKYGRKHLGRAVISVGGIKWKPYRKKSPTKLLKWHQLADL